MKEAPEIASAPFLPLCAGERQLSFVEGLLSPQFNRRSPPTSPLVDERRDFARVHTILMRIIVCKWNAFPKIPAIQS
jgi:hypothetical protein